MTEQEAYRVLQVLPGAHPKVIRAAHTVLRELALADPSDDAPRRLVELGRALVVLRDLGRIDPGAGPHIGNLS